MTVACEWYGTLDNDTLIFANTDIDVVYADAGNDYIADGQGAMWSSDRFFGQSGKDKLVSLGGNDFLHGGSGNDFIRIMVGQYNAGSTPGFPTGSEDWQGFDVTVYGGNGIDTLRLSNSDGYSVEVDGDKTIITTRYSGEITVRGIEHFEFL